MLVLCSDHVNDLLQTEQRFKDHYNINQTEGKIGRLYGFDIYEYDGTPYYNSAGKKLAWGAVPGATDSQSLTLTSTAFVCLCLRQTVVRQ